MLKSLLKDVHFTALNEKSSYYKEVKKLDNKNKFDIYGEGEIKVIFTK